MEPYLWGEANNCFFSEQDTEGLGIHGNISFFLPWEQGYIAPSDWDGPQGTWMSLDGQFDFGEDSISGAYHLMLDAGNETQLLWENGSERFALALDLDLDPETLSDPEALQNLTLTIRTGTGNWACDFDTLTCTGPNGESQSL